MESQSEKQALEKFLYENEDLERLENIVDKFNIFTALRLTDVEIRHSDFLCWLMNPTANHDLGDYFLKTLVRRAVFDATKLGLATASIFDVDSWDMDSAEVLREWHHIDILVRDDINKFICIIENKVHAKESEGQLEKYRKDIDREFPNYTVLLIYLTIEGEHPSEQSNYVPMSYSEIVSLIEQVLDRKRDNVNPEVVMFMEHYSEMLRRYIVEDSEVQAICKKIYSQHREALELIWKNIPDAQMKIGTCLQEAIRNDPDYILDSSARTYIHFIPQSMDYVPHDGAETWVKSKRILLFEIYNGSERVAISLIIGPGPQEIRQKLYNFAKANIELFAGARRKLTPQWCSIYTTPLLSKKEIDDIKDKEISQIKPIIDERLKAFKQTSLPKVENEFKKVEHEFKRLSST
jgi:hypothetical protein